MKRQNFGQGITAVPPVRYDTTTIILHWLTAVLAVTLFLLAEFWGYFPRPSRHLMIVAHMSLGILLTLVLVLRIAWRSVAGREIPESTGLDHLAARAVHYLLYALLVAQVILGFMLRWTDNQALSFFGLLIPSPFGEFSRATGHFVDELHDLNGWAIMILAGGHAAAALLHQFANRDNVLFRMLPISRLLQAGSKPLRN